MRAEQPPLSGLSRPDAVLFDIGMTMIFPSGKVIAREIGALSPASEITPAEAARALAIAAEAHHLSVRGAHSAVDRVGLSMAHVLGIPPDLAVEAWRAAAACPDLYSVLDPHSLPLLQTLHCAGVKTAAVSNALNCVHDELAAFGLLRHFDVVIGSSDGYPDKPHRGMFDAALSALHVRAVDAWHVGDGLINDILGASRAGIGEQILLDRYGIYTKPPCPVAGSMREILEAVKAL